MEDLSLYFKYLKLAKKYSFLIIFALVIDGVIALFELVLPLLSKILFDYVYPFRDFQLLNIIIIATVVLYFLELYFSIVADYFDIYISQRLNYKITGELFSKLLKLPLIFHQKQKWGDLTVRITENVETLVNTIATTLPSFILQLIKLAAIFFITFKINPTITLLALASIPFYIIETKFYSKKLASVEQDTLNIESHFYDNLKEKLTSIKTIKAFSQEESETINLKGIIKKKFRLNIKEKFIEVIAAFTNSITLKVWSIFINWFMGYQVIKGTISIGEIVALNMYFLYLSVPIKNLSSLFTSWSVALVSFRRIDEIFATNDENYQSGGDLKISKGEIKFKDVKFGYNKTDQLLSNLNFSIKSNSMFAIVGGSGVGKTTLANLILKFFDLRSGAIYIDGQNIFDIKPSSLREQIGIVPQEIDIFNDTVLKNIAYGHPAASLRDAELAAKLAGADEFIDCLPEKFNTLIGINHLQLSVGQAQRIAIARALIKNPKIVILDEATSALDAISEYHIQETIKNLRKEKTVLVVAHRLSTIKMADTIIVIDNGEIVETGNYKELIAKKNHFYKFYLKQFASYHDFKNRLEMEFERVERYKTPLSLVAIKVANYNLILNKCGIDATNNILSDIYLKIQRTIRIMDFSSPVEKGVFLVAAPSINNTQIENFISRLTVELKNTRYKYLPNDVSIDFLVNFTNYDKPTLQTVEDLINLTIKDLI